MSIRMAVPDADRPPPLADRVLALAAFVAAIVLLRCLPFRGTLAVARTVKYLARRPAERGHARRAVAARTWAARWFPGRAACLELSLAALLTAAIRGRRVDWCIGCRFNPCESHAWIEADGQPVGEPTAPDHTFYVTVRV